MIAPEDKQEFGPCGKPDLPMSGPALRFEIGNRSYFLSRSRDGNAWRIVANGDLVESASILHYGDVAAFVKIATRLKEIETAWAQITLADALIAKLEETK